MLTMICLYPLIIVKMSKKNLATKMRTSKIFKSSKSTPISITVTGPSSPSSIDHDRRKASILLIVLIVEFIICWTPLYLYHTIGIFNKTFYRSIPSIIPNLILFLSFVSTSCNPITYYFMSRRFRKICYESFKQLYRRKYRSNLDSVFYERSEGILQVRRVKSNPI